MPYNQPTNQPTNQPNIDLLSLSLSLIPNTLVKGMNQLLNGMTIILLKDVFINFMSINKLVEIIFIYKYFLAGLI